jgi:cytochrome b
MDDWMDYHEIGGYVLLSLILFRIVWGFVGSTYARFRQFLYSPAVVLSYSKTLLQSDSQAYAGHNPMGGLAVVVLILLLLMQAITGLFMTDDIFFYGPYYPSVSDEVQKLMSSLHHTTFEVLLWFIGIHIVTIVFYEFYKKQRLVSAMFTGRKQNATDSGINDHYSLRALLVVGIAGALVYCLVAVFAPETVDYF